VPLGGGGEHDRRHDRPVLAEPAVGGDVAPAVSANRADGTLDATAE
jgi:hypothetical protein